MKCIHFLISVICVIIFANAEEHDFYGGHKLRLPIRSVRRARESFSWNKFYRLDVIYDWLDSLAVKYPKQVTVFSIGKTYENRTIKTVKISHGKSERTVAIEGGIHANEWISPSTVTYIINEILNGTDPIWTKISQEFDWYFIPVLNPDGYEYSHTTERSWRKNRYPFSSCFGVDLNRNFDVLWGPDTSADQCEETYGGPKPFSELESQAISKLITSISKNLKVYLSFHSAAQLLLIPFVDVDNYDVEMFIGNQTINALYKRYGTVYDVGKVGDIIYNATGTSMDWVKISTNVPLTYTYELRDNGLYGQEMPDSEIIPNNLEVMDSLVAMFETAVELGVLD